MSFLRNIESRLAIALFLILPAVYAQTETSGDVAGVVKDTTDAVVANATVTITSVSEGNVRNATSNESGAFRFTFLKPGEYTVSAQTGGLKTDLVKVAVQVGQVATINLIAKVLATQQVVEVTSAAAAINTENANLSTTITSKQVLELPTPGGDITTVAFTVPGVVVSTGAGYGNFSSHGLPGTANLFTMNGNDYNDPYLNLNNSGASNLLLGQNEVQEVAVVQNAYSVQYGRQAGAQINYTTRSGSNDIHGNLMWSWNGDRLNANSFFNNANGIGKPRSISNEWADSIGGRIIKDKLFFYVDNEGLYYTLPSSGVVTLPSPQLQAYTLSNITPAQQALYQSAFALFNGAPGATRAVPITNGNGNLQDSTGRLGCGDFASTNTQAAGGGIFGATVPCGNSYATNSSNQNREWFLATRADWNINDKQKIFFRYKHDTGYQPTGTDLINPVFNLQSIQPQNEGQVNYTYIFSPNVVNNFVGSALVYSAIFGPASDTASLAAFPTWFWFNGDGGANGGTFGGPQVFGLHGLGAPWFDFPQGRNVSQGQLIDDISIVKGNHTIKIGANFRKDNVSDHFPQVNTAGYYRFFSLTDFVNGVTDPNTFTYYSQNFPSILVAHSRFYNLGVYAQDEWNAKPNLKLTVGLRLDRTANPSCVSPACFSNLTQTFSNVGFPGTMDTPYNQVINSGLSHAYYQTDPVVIDPRLGVVWSPRGSGKTVIRGGIGIFSDLAPGQLVQNIFSNAPGQFSPLIFNGQTVGTVNDPASASTAALNQYDAFRTGFAAGYNYNQLNTSVPGGFSPVNIFSIPQKFETPRYIEYSFEIQQPIGAKNVLVATYTGNRGYNLLTINGFVNASNGNGFGGLPTIAKDGAFGQVLQLNNSGLSRYNGLTVQFRRSFSYGFQGQIGYTWSHALDDISNGGANEPFSFQPGAGLAFLSSPSVRANYGNSDYDIRNNLLADLIWDTPWKFNNKAVNMLAGGWTFSSKFIYRSGLPFSIIDSALAGAVSPAINGTILASYAVNSGANQHCGASNVNTPCFASSDFIASGSETGFGNVQRNSYYGPHYFDWDAALFKNFAVTERMRFTLGASFFNLTNHPNFGNPNADVAGGGLGLITGVVIPPTSAYGSFQGSVVSGRVMVLTGRFNF